MNVCKMLSIHLKSLSFFSTVHEENACNYCYVTILDVIVLVFTLQPTIHPSILTTIRIIMYTLAYMS